MTYKTISLKALMLPAVLSLTVCSSLGKITATRDEFKNTTVVAVDLEESEMNTSGISVVTNFSRIIDDKGTETMNMRVNIALGVGVAPLKEQVFLKIDETKFELPLSERVIRAMTRTTAMPIAGTNQTQVMTQSWEVHSGLVNFSGDALKGLQNGSSLLLRAYTGEKPLDFKFSPKNIKKIKELLVYDLKAAK